MNGLKDIVTGLWIGVKCWEYIVDSNTGELKASSFYLIPS